MQIIDYDIISSCVLNSILGLDSFIRVIIIYMSEWVYMYIYQSSRVTLAVTGVCIGAHSCIIIIYMSEWVYMYIYQSSRVSVQ